MAKDQLTVALLTEIFHDDPGGDRLGRRLGEARTLGAELAVLPELPLNVWCPAGRTPADQDAEPPDGPRQAAQATAAAEAGLFLLGGAIVRCPDSGRRHNTAILFDPRGTRVGAYRKLHLPEEEGFWETSHYEPGDDPPAVMDVGEVPVGVQICSDLTRPEGTHLLGALGAEIILAPRATPLETYRRWRVVLRANAVTSCTFVVSVNRPGPEAGVPIGGPSVAIAPTAEVLLETEERLAIVTLDRAAVRDARSEYPGYLPIRSDLYARGWRLAGDDDGGPG